MFPAGLRVLVVDDDPTWLKILEKMLRKCSYEGQSLPVLYFLAVPLFLAPKHSLIFQSDLECSCEAE